MLASIFAPKSARTNTALSRTHRRTLRLLLALTATQAVSSFSLPLASPPASAHRRFSSPSTNLRMAEAKPHNVCAISLNTFLKESKDAVGQLHRQDQKMLMVMGNEASDCDSIVSSIIAAYGVSQGCLSGVGAYDLVVPVINIPREDLALRQDAVLLLKEARVDDNHLVFFPEVGESLIKGLMQKKMLSLLLVDHNKLGVDQEWLSPSVVGILDHHENTGAYPDASPRVIDDKVGSCSSLIAEALHGDNLYQLRTFTQKFGETVSILLGGALLLDTRMFQGKCTDLDRKVGVGLGYMVDGAGNGEAKYFYDRLLQARTDVRALNSEQKLRKDYKKWGLGAKGYGIATVPVSIGSWQEDDGNLSESIAAAARKEGVDLYLVMLTFEDHGVFRRQIVVHAKDQDLLDACCGFLVKSDHPAVQEATGKGSLELERLEAGGSLTAVYEQKNLKASRKQVQPVVHSFMNSR